MSRGRLAAFGVGLGLIAAQAGHVIAYEVRYGSAAEHVQSAGGHAYFPTVAKAAFGLVAAFLLLALAAVAVARLLSARRLESAPAPSLLRVVSLLFCFQLACFAVQETVEMAAGAPVASAPALLLWGTVGQLPAALVAALVLRWLAVRVGPAVACVLAAPAGAVRFVPQTAALVAWPAPAALAVEDGCRGRAFSRRGPPL